MVVVTVEKEDICDLMYKLLTDNTLPDAPSFTEEQWDALCEHIPMTQTLFETCLKLCCVEQKTQMYKEVCKEFPLQYAVYQAKMEK